MSSRETKVGRDNKRNSSREIGIMRGHGVEGSLGQLMPSR